MKADSVRLSFKKLIPCTFFMLLILAPSYASTASATPSCQCVAFRFDDIQDYWLDSVQTKIIDTFHQKNASLTIGIIGNHIGGDPKLVLDIKSKLGKTSKLELANHGWNHEDFTQFGREQQNTFMKNTNDKISSIFGVVPTTFIPPFNTVNSDTMIAFFENGFQYISADMAEDNATVSVANARVYHIPGNAQTSNLTGNGNAWKHYDNTHLLVTIMGNIQKYGYAVVVLHAPEYASLIHSHYVNVVDKAQIKNLGLLIGEIQNRGIKIVTISQIPHNMNNKPYPQWLNTVFIWNKKGIISDNEVLSNISYLLNNKVISPVSNKS